MATATCIYLVDPVRNEVLMARKGRKIGKGKLFGYGGKIEDSQTIDECSFEEFKKESGGIKIDPKLIEYFAYMKFYNGINKNPLYCDPDFEVLFGRLLCNKEDFNGIKSTAEMYDPRWIPILSIPWNDTKEMMAGDKLFVPLVLLGGRYATGYIWQKEDGTEVYGSKIEYCPKL